MRTLLTLTLALAIPLQAKTMITKKPFGKMQDGTPVDIYTLKNDKIEATITNYGCRIVSLIVPDRNGKNADVVIGFSNFPDYLKTNPYFGAVVGRYGNRIGNARFTLDGHTYTLANNDNGNSLHGGLIGFDKKVWQAHIDGDALVLTYLSKDGEEGYPGNLTSTVKYSLGPEEVRIDYTATTDKDTVLNLTNHSYFNLAGQGSTDVLNHEVMIMAERFTPVNKTLIPTGELRPVAGTPFDFRTPHPIGERIGQTSDKQIEYGGGYDHNWVLNMSGSPSPKLAARVHEPSTGRTLEVLTTQPGIQFYTGNFLDGTITGKAGKVYKRRFAFCMETQHFPDSPNRPNFPSSELKPGQTYNQTTIFRFSAN